MRNSWTLTLLLTFLSLKVFAQDNRILVTNPEEFPAVGRIFSLIPPTTDASKISFEGEIKKLLDSNSRKNQATELNFCSGALTSEATIVTAAHCALKTINFQKIQIPVFFQPAARGSDRVPISYISKFGSMREDKQFKDDWALLRLEQKIQGIEPLHFIRLDTNQHPAAELISIGYPWEANGRVLAGFQLLKSNCRILTWKEKEQVILPAAKKREEGSFATNCFVSENNSGGPLLIKKQTPQGPIYRIVGVSVVKQNRIGFWSGLLGLQEPMLSFAVPSSVILDAALK